MRLSAINSTNSAFCMFAFDPDYFLSLSLHQGKKVEAQIALKPILSVLKSRGRNVERLQLNLSPSDAVESRFTITLHCAHGITKTHKLTYSPRRGLLPTADPNPPHYFALPATTAAEWLDHFLSSSRTGEITFVATPTTLVARSSETELPDLASSSTSARKAIHTQVKIALEEFKEYSILEDVALTLSLREFKATVGLAESWGVGVEVCFGKGEEPIFVRLRVEGGVAGEFVIATTRGERTAAGTEGERDGEARAQVALSRRSESSTASIPPRNEQELPNQSTPLPQPAREQVQEDPSTQPLFFPAPSPSSQLSLAPTQEELAFVQPTPVAQGGDPAEFLAPSPSPPPSSLSQTNDRPKKRFNPLF